MLMPQGNIMMIMHKNTSLGQNAWLTLLVEKIKEAYMA